MSKKESLLEYVSIPAPAPVQAHHCASCGYDPVNLWEGHNIVGGEWTYRIETKGQLCLTCAESSAFHLARQYSSFLNWGHK